MRPIDPSYLDVLDPDRRLPSYLVALLPAERDDPGVTSTIARLEEAAFEVVDRRMAAERDIEGARWELEVDLQWPSEPEPRAYRLWMEPSEQLDDAHLEWGFLTPDDGEAAQQSVWSIGVSTVFGESPLEDYHRQLQVLAAVAPDAALVFDISAGWPRPGPWLLDTAAANVPPAPDNLYSVHAVLDDEDRGIVWLHTHGLLRSGSLELEMLEVPADDAGTLCNLLNAAAAMTLELGPPPPEEPFLVGQGLELVWLPWEKGVSHVSRHAPGARRDRDEFHSHPSAVLFAPSRRKLGLFGSRFANPKVYLPILNDNPLLYVSNLETSRMSLLANERLDRFLALFEAHGGDEQWLFLVKLGYAVDDAEEPDDREHLWFEVHAAREDTVEATLINEPYGIARMHQGQRDHHSLDLLSDWSVHCPHGSFDPDTVGQLERALP